VGLLTNIQFEHYFKKGTIDDAPWNKFFRRELLLTTPPLRGSRLAGLRAGGGGQSAKKSTKDSAQHLKTGTIAATPCTKSTSPAKSAPTPAAKKITGDNFIFSLLQKNPRIVLTEAKLYFRRGRVNKLF